MVGGAVCGLHVDYGLALHDQIELTSRRTMRAGSQDLPDLPVTVGGLTLQSESTGRTYARTVTAGLTSSLLVITAKGSIHDVCGAGAAV